MTKLTKVQIKNYGLAVAVALVVLFGSCSIYLGIKNKSTLRDLNAERDRYGLVVAEKERLDSLEAVRLAMVEERDKIITDLRKKYRWRMAEVKNLKDSLAIKNNEADAVSADSSYEYINAVYPAVRERVFPIDSFQVKTFHKLDINYKGELAINNSMSSALTELKSVSDSYFLQSENYKTLYMNSEEKSEAVQNENTALNSQVKTLNKEANKQRLLKNISSAALLGTTAYIIINSLLK